MSAVKNAIKKVLGPVGRDPRVRRAWWRLSGTGRIIPTRTIRALQSRRLRDLASWINLTPCEVPTEGVDGWLSWNERRALYALASRIDGPFLEVGSWVGLSTCLIASAIRETGVTKRFITTCLNETMDNFKECGPSIGFFYPPGPDRPRGLAPRELFEAEIKPVITSPGGVIGTLKRNLDRLGLSRHVEIHEGSFEQVAPRLPYKFIFADVLHDPDEIELNAPLLRDFLESGMILACHDVAMDPRNEASLRKHLPIGESFVVDSLLVGEVV
jgi:hypothetical protein